MVPVNAVSRMTANGVEVRRPSGRYASPQSISVAAAALLISLGCRSSTGGSAEPPTGANLLENPDFEIWFDQQPRGWLFEDRVKHKGKLLREAKLINHGAAALRLEPGAANHEDLLPFAIGQGLAADALRGKTVRLCAWIAAGGGARAVVGLYAVRPDGGIVASAEYVRDESRAGLACGERVLTLPRDPAIMLLIVRCAVLGQKGWACFDNLEVKLSDPPAMAPAAPIPDSAREAPSLQAEVTLDAGRPVRRIPRTLYGTNIDWTHDGMGLWNARRAVLDAQLVRLTAELGTTLLRFPGGVTADFYDWRNGVGPQDQRPTREHFSGGPRSRHSFGTDEVLDFARSVGAELLITVNAGTGRPEDAAEWIRYIREQSRARGTPPVRYWEVGNELYIKDESPQSQAVAISPQEYADRFLRFATAMRAADASIKIGAIGGENYGRYTQNSFPDWNPTVLKAAAEHMDFLAVHNAYAPLIADSKASVREVYAALLAAPVLISQNLQTLDAQIRRYCPQRAETITIAVTEWGPFFHTRPDSPFVDHVQTLGSALYVASVLKAFLESPRVEVASAFRLNEIGFMGWIGQRGGQWVAKAPYLAMQMYTQHFGGTLVRSSCQSPTYENRAIGFVEAVRHVPYLDVVASLSDDCRTLYLMAINKHLDRPITADVRVEGFEPLERAVAVTLTGTGIDANVGAELPRIPGLKWARQAEDERSPRFARGGPDEVTVQSAEVGGLSRSFQYTFPAHSVTSLRLRQRSAGE